MSDYLMNKSSTSSKLDLLLISLLFVVAPLYSPESMGGAGLRLPSNIAVWLVATIYIAVCLRMILSTKLIKLPKYHLIIFSVPALITMSSFIAGVDDSVRWLFKFLTLWAAYLFFIAALQKQEHPQHFESLLVIIVISAFIHSVFGYLQITFPDFFPGLFTSKNLPEGLFRQINNQASYQATCLAIILFLFSKPSAPKMRSVLGLLGAVAAVMSTYVVAISGSRAGLVAILLVWSAFAIYKVSSKCRTNHALLFLMALSVVTLLAGVSQNDRSIDKIAAMNSGYSKDMRKGIYSISLNLIKDKPVFGYGLGSFSSVYQNARVDFIAEHPGAYFNNRGTSHPHNELLLWFIEGGILAFLAVVLFMGIIIRQLWNYGAEGWRYAALLLPIAFHTQVETPMYTSSLHYFTFLLLLVGVFSWGLKSKPLNFSAALIVTSMSFVAVALTVSVFFLTHTLFAERDLVKYFKNMHPENHYLLKKPLANIYLSDTAELFLYRDTLHVAMVMNNKKMLTDSLSWAENRVQKLPELELFYWLVNGHEKLEQRQKACDFAQRGLAIFPRALKLKRYAGEYCVPR
jgi:O-antigen polymerase